LVLTFQKTKAALVTQCGFKRQLRLNLCFFCNFNNRLAPIAAAFRANSVRNMILAAGLTNDQMIQSQRIMRTAFVPPGW
jgi:hypothetical protein